MSQGDKSSEFNKIEAKQSVTESVARANENVVASAVSSEPSPTASAPPQNPPAPKPSTAAAQPKKKEIPPAPPTETRPGVPLEDPELRLTSARPMQTAVRLVVVGLITLSCIVGAEIFIRTALIPRQAQPAVLKESHR